MLLGIQRTSQGVRSAMASMNWKMAKPRYSHSKTAVYLITKVSVVLSAVVAIVC